MKKTLQLAFVLALTLCFASNKSFSQAEWRLSEPTYSSGDPDGGGPANGTVTFTYQIRSTGATIADVSAISTGWSWQSATLMIPVQAGSGGTGVVPPGCTTVNTPSNVTLSAAFVAAGFQYNTVNQCFLNPQTTGGQVFDRTAIGTLETSGTINLTNAWTDVFTVTMWTLPIPVPQRPYVIINSTNLGSPGPFANYEISDNLANAYQANSLTYSTPLALGPNAAPLPVKFTKFDAQCSGNGTSITWSTASEKDNAYFEIEKSNDGASWSSIGRVTSNSNRVYAFTDKAGGPAVYRVKQVDLNGTATYTNLVRTSCSSASFFVNLFPIPAKDKVTLVVGSDRNIKTTLRVVDNYGRVVMNVPLTISKGTNNFTLDVNRLSQGQYYIRSNEGGLDINQRFTITR